MTTHDWPGFRSVVSSAFFPVRRVSRSRSIFNAARKVQDLGVIWRASVVLRPADKAERYAIEGFIRRFQGGDLLRFYDLDYVNCAPIGTGRSRTDLLAGADPRATWSGGATWTGGGAWSAALGLRFGQSVVPGQTSVRMRGGYPGDQVVAEGDTLARDQDGAAVAMIAAASAADPAGRFHVTLEADHQITAPINALAVVGLPILRTFEIVNLDALSNNRRAVNALPNFEFDLIEAA
ncbi:MAG: hypothetical protein AAGD13_00585 [Pseudomonadota bacterium]